MLTAHLPSLRCVFTVRIDNFEAALPTKHLTMKWLFVPDETRLVFEQKTSVNGKHCHGRTQMFSEALLTTKRT